MEKELNNKKDLNHKNGLPLADYIREYYEIPEVDIRRYSPLVLAYIGDGVYDLVVRTFIVENGNAPVNKLHRKAAKMVKATGQAELFHKIEGDLSEEEISVFKRGRNAKSFTSAKNTSKRDYSIATGMEALIGYLYLTNQTDRILELLKKQLKVEDE